MEFLALLYTVLLVAICLLQALLLYRSGKQAPRQDDEALKEWVRQQLDAQSKLFAQKQAELARQNYDAMRGISETLQTAVQGMSSTLNAGQALLHGLLLGALPCGKGGAHALHRSLQRFTDVAHSGKVLLRHLCQLRVHLAVLRFQLLTQPFLPFCIVPVCGRLCRAVQQQGHHQADGHQKHRVKKR